MDTLLSAFMGPAVQFQIRLVNADPGAAGRPPKRVTYANGGGEDLVVFKGAEAVAGEVTVIPTRSGRVDHIGIKVELVGLIQPVYAGGGMTPFEFMQHVRELEPPGSLDSVRAHKFRFDDVDKPHESYEGLNVRLRYFVRVTVSRSMAANVFKEQDMWVVNVPPPPAPDVVVPPIRSQVGIKNCLTIEVEWAKERFHLREIIFGKVTFLQVRVKIAKMKVALVRKEKTGMGENAAVTNETLMARGDSFAQYEVMDGCPVMGEVVPVRLFLSHYDGLTPTYKNVSQHFSVRYFLNVIIIDEMNRRYFKHEEIFLYRRDAVC